MPSVQLQVLGTPLSLSFAFTPGFLTKKRQTLRRVASSLARVFDASPPPAREQTRRLQLSRRISYPVLSKSSSEPDTDSAGWSSWGIRTPSTSTADDDDWSEVDPFRDWSAADGLTSRFSMSFSTLAHDDHRTELKPSNSVSSRGHGHAQPSPGTQKDSHPPTYSVAFSAAPSYISGFPSLPPTPTSPSPAYASPSPPPRRPVPPSLSFTPLSTPPRTPDSEGFAFNTTPISEGFAFNATPAPASEPASSVESFATSSRNWWADAPTGSTFESELADLASEQDRRERKGWSSLVGSRRSV